MSPFFIYVFTQSAQDAALPQEETMLDAAAEAVVSVAYVNLHRHVVVTQQAFLPLLKIPLVLFPAPTLPFFV